MKQYDFLKNEIRGRELEQFPLQWEDIFGRDAPLAVEVGCGNGEFLAAWAQNHPDWNFVGVELSLESMERILKRVHQLGLANVRAVRDDARFVLREFFANNSVKSVMMNFPDPWPKERHRHRRIVIPSFVRTLAAVLEPGGVYELVTDQEWYAGESAQLFRDSGYFDVHPVAENPHRSVTTKYERKWRAAGRSIFQLRAIKRKTAPVHRLLENPHMPHVIIDHSIDSKKIFALKNYLKKEDDWLFTVKEVFYNPENQAHLLRTVASDGDYHQSFFMIISPHPQGYIVKIDPVFQPYRTPAVKHAVWEVGKLLREV